MKNDLNVMRDHVVKLAKDMNVQIQFGNEFSSAVYTSRITIRNLNNEREYASALHELGHQHNRIYEKSSGFRIPSSLLTSVFASKDDWFEILKEEHSAWKFAKNEVDRVGPELNIQWSEDMEWSYFTSFGSYIQGAVDELKLSDKELLSFLAEGINKRN